MKLTTDETLANLAMLNRARWSDATGKDGWRVVEHELRDGEKLLAWIEQRNRYCDRGHWKAMVECVPYLDHQDGFPRYYMKLATAKVEVEAFLRWRLCGVRAEETPPTILDAIVGEPK